MEIIVHHKISDLYKALNLPFEQEIDFTILSIPDIHHQIPFKSPKFRAGYFSANDMTYGVLEALGFRGGSVSIPGQILPEHCSV